MKISILAKPCSTIINKTGGWRTYKPKFDHDKCISCGTCVKLCPEGIVKMGNQLPKPKPLPDYDFCKGCGICAAECPANAIEMLLDKK